MESKDYFEKVMQDYNQHRNGRILRKYCKDVEKSGHAVTAFSQNKVVDLSYYAILIKIDYQSITRSIWL